MSWQNSGAHWRLTHFHGHVQRMPCSSFLVLHMLPHVLKLKPSICKPQAHAKGHDKAGDALLTHLACGTWTAQEHGVLLDQYLLLSPSSSFYCAGPG